MQIVIDIPKIAYDLLKSDETIDWLDAENILSCVEKGKIIPKEHGRLSDMDELVKNIVKDYGVNSIHELPQDIKIFYDKFINSAPTILDATFDYKLKNYTFFRKE